MSLKEQVYEEVKEEFEDSLEQNASEKTDKPIYLKDYVNETSEKEIEKVAEYLASAKDNADKVGTGIGACIFSPALIIFMMTFSEATYFDEDIAALIGVLGMLGLVGHSIYTFIRSGITKKDREKLLDDVNINSEIEDYVYDLDRKYRKTHDKKLSLGILSIMFCYVPLVIAAIFTYDDVLLVSMVNVLLALIGIGVYLIVSSSMIKSSFKRVLKNNYFTRVKNDPEAKVFRTIFPAIFWPVISTLYIVVSLISGAWGSTWMIWPVSGILYNIIYKVVSHILARN